MPANAHTLVYDSYEVMSEHSRGGRTPADEASSVTLPALVLAGGASPRVDDRRQQSDRGRPAERATPRPRGP